LITVPKDMEKAVAAPPLAWQGFAVTPAGVAAADTCRQSVYERNRTADRCGSSIWVGWIPPHRPFLRTAQSRQIRIKLISTRCGDRPSTSRQEGAQSLIDCRRGCDQGRHPARVRSAPRPGNSSPGGRRARSVTGLIMDAVESAKKGRQSSP